MKANQDDVIKKFKNKHGDKYIYDLVVYEKAIIKVSIICKIHGIFNITPNSHINGSGCYKCGLINSGLNGRLGTDAFIQKSSDIHNNRYTYDKCLYTTYYDKVIITCKIHGDFQQQPRKHLAGQGCKKCAGQKQYCDFIKKCEEKYTGYTYDKVIYDGMFNDVIITCDIHGDFKTKPVSFLHKSRTCKKCRVKTKSNMETEWLNTFNIEFENRNVYIKLNNKTYCVDGIDKDNMIIYEFYGDFFHGNPDLYKSEEINPLLKETYGSLYNKTKIKENDIISSGYKLIHIWENDFTKNKIKQK
jgi:hypothetical protein